MQKLKIVLLWVMGIFYVFAGIMHFANTAFYLRIMPAYLPWHLALVYLSGVIEIGLGVLVLIPAVRPLAAWGIVALLIAVFPANLHMALHNIPLQPGTPPSPLALWLRLPLQGVLIAWAWWYTRRTPVHAMRRRSSLRGVDSYR
jgi:uncharacterized membrane protein